MVLGEKTRGLVLGVLSLRWRMVCGGRVPKEKCLEFIEVWAGDVYLGVVGVSGSEGGLLG